MRGYKMNAILVEHKDGTYSVEMIPDDKRFDEHPVQHGEEVNLIRFVKTKFIEEDTGTVQVVEH